MTPFYKLLKNGLQAMKRTFFNSNQTSAGKKQRLFTIDIDRTCFYSAYITIISIKKVHHNTDKEQYGRTISHRNVPGKEIVLLPNMANRHGLITGATGTGKTVTLQKMAESFASIGVPIFMADVKGDLSGIRRGGRCLGKIAQTSGIASASKNLIRAPTQRYSGMSIGEIGPSGARDCIRYGTAAAGASA
ncbi:MAG: DUF853 domain-containing protein [Desulfobacterales bacterium]|nr:DUF853 domain-containing protein [Desulfobacterales bacterium]